MFRTMKLLRSLENHRPIGGSVANSCEASQAKRIFGYRALKAVFVLTVVFVIVASIGLGPVGQKPISLPLWVYL